uniref:Phospholipase A2 inhibitor gammaCdcPLI (Fragments) n=1 Tax=Crotalus durissus terrificus TaxID=8732 RepID=PLIG_CRODU|nr:RecName: Full=Phospholipase A2 inhibitor gammaCdcPLI; AltName: Full=gamma-PLI [Crotalus durissus collilineatus]
SCDFCHNIGKDCDGYEEECSSPEDVCGKNCFSSSICKELCEDQPEPGEPLSKDSTEYEAICKYEQFPGDISYNLKGCVSSCPLLSLSNATFEQNR